MRKAILLIIFVIVIIFTINLFIDKGPKKEAIYKMAEEYYSQKYFREHGLEYESMTIKKIDIKDKTAVVYCVGKFHDNNRNIHYEEVTFRYDKCKNNEWLAPID